MIHDPPVIRCLIVDDNPDFLAAARMVLESESLEIVGSVSTFTEAVAAARELQPDLVLVDMYLGDESGIELARQINDDASLGEPAVILISSYGNGDLAELVAESPAVGFLSKAQLSETAIRSTLDAGGR